MVNTSLNFLIIFIKYTCSFTLIAPPNLLCCRTDNALPMLKKSNTLKLEPNLVNPNKLNANFLVFVEVLLDKTTPHVLDDFIDAVTQYPEIVECHMVSGGFDFLIKLRSGGMEEFRRIAGQILWQLPGVKETRSYPVMQVVKDSSKIKIKSRSKF